MKSSTENPTMNDTLLRLLAAQGIIPTGEASITFDFQSSRYTLWWMKAVARKAGVKLTITYRVRGLWMMEGTVAGTGPDAAVQEFERWVREHGDSGDGS
jgi:hypothetical protein